MKENWVRRSQNRLNEPKLGGRERERERNEVQRKEEKKGNHDYCQLDQ